ncbi:MAG: 16S rRNA (cytosine(1402)-N(4))-methyltransferase RsmH [Syntrophobacterales bacterium]|nr:16S rRNA (cytosine(1402)-N(4))-methyltransferase RsmH [Syntrophobacterales bacterium]
MKDQIYEGQRVYHRPVLLKETIDILLSREGTVFLDGTVGSGGYTQAILERLSPKGVVIGLDKDDAAIERTQSRLKHFVASGQLKLYQESFDRFPAVLHREGIDQIDGAVLDLGVSIEQLMEAGRGFSFLLNGPLDMRMDRRMKKTASDLVMELSERELAEIFLRYGEERYARRIASAIVKARKSRPIKTTGDLVNIILSVLPEKEKRSRIHPATRVFQSLRITLNKELEALSNFLDVALDYIRPGGVLCIVSFHSLEDRIVKERFKGWARSCSCPPGTLFCQCEGKPKVVMLTRKAIKPSEDEIKRNPRARSAKLRAVARWVLG